jgi:hypothetical protein
MGINVASLPALTATTTLIAAIVAGLVAVWVATLNARTARAVARDNAHREHRQRSVRPMLKHTRLVRRQVKAIRKAAGVENAEATLLPPIEQLWDGLMHGSGEAPALFVRDPGLQDAARLVMDGAGGLTASVNPTDLPNPLGRWGLIVSYCNALELACMAIELHIEAYVYGVSRRVANQLTQRARDAMRATRKELASSLVQP